jgi:hypothetical protein
LLPSILLLLDGGIEIERIELLVSDFVAYCLSIKNDESNAVLTASIRPSTIKLRLSIYKW